MSDCTRRDFLAVSASASLVGIGQAAPPKLTVSTWELDVTPPIGHPCMGGGIAPIREVIDPLYVHGFVLEGAGDPVAVIAVDWCEIRNDAYDRWRDAVATAIGTKRERVLVSSLHQHDAPVADLTAQQLLNEAKAKGAICDLEFHERTVQRVAKAAGESRRRAVPVTHVGTGQAKVEQVASNRRYLDAAGQIRFDRGSATRDPKIRERDGGTIDPHLKTLSLWNGDKPILALHAYATHPMSYYGRGGASADFVGLARRLRRVDDATVFQMYVSGCSGNVTAGKYNDGAAENRVVLARRLHDDMRSAFKATAKTPVESCAFRTTPVRLPVRTSKGFSESELKAILKDDSKPFKQCLAAMGLSWRKRANQAIDVCALDFGNAAYLLLPAEAYVEYQLMAQAVRPKGFVVTAGYGECAPGYIPIEQAWKENDSNLGDWCWVDPNCEPLMKRAIEEVLK